MGFAREAVDAALRWCDTHIENDMTVCIIDPANVASICIAQAVGFVQHVEVTINNPRCDSSTDIALNARTRLATPLLCDDARIWRIFAGHSEERPPLLV